MSLLRRGDRMPPVHFVKARYLGGHDRPRPQNGPVSLTEKGLRFHALGGFTVPLQDVVDVQVIGGESDSRVTATRAVALGLFALAAKKRTDRAAFAADLVDGRQIVFEVEDVTAAELAGRLAGVRPYLTATGTSSLPPP